MLESPLMDFITISPFSTFDAQKPNINASSIKVNKAFS